MLEDDLSLVDILDAESEWSPRRIALIRAMLERGLSPADFSESLHWNWASKVIRLARVGLGGLSPARGFGIRAVGSWQGLLLADGLSKRARLSPGRMHLVYVEFVEAAPWNWDIENLQQGLFGGIGVQLMEMAVRWSISEGFAGRVGLHSLSKAEGFYRRRCGMTDLGPDDDYEGLRYFEMTREQARRFLREK